MSEPKLPPNGFEAGKTYRFRTLIDRAIGMPGVPAGTKFRTGCPLWNVEFENPGFEGEHFGCATPSYWVTRGHIEWLPDLYGNEEDE